jgi:hypothetical protein
VLALVVVVKTCEFEALAIELEALLVSVAFSASSASELAIQARTSCSILVKTSSLSKASAL